MIGLLVMLCASAAADLEVGPLVCWLLLLLSSGCCAELLSWSAGRSTGHWPLRRVSSHLIGQQSAMVTAAEPPAATNQPNGHISPAFVTRGLRC